MRRTFALIALVVVSDSFFVVVSDSFFVVVSDGFLVLFLIAFFGQRTQRERCLVGRGNFCSSVRMSMHPSVYLFNHKSGHPSREAQRASESLMYPQGASKGLRWPQGASDSLRSASEGLRNLEGPQDTSRNLREPPRASGSL